MVISKSTTSKYKIKIKIKNLYYLKSGVDLTEDNIVLRTHFGYCWSIFFLDKKFYY